jgi:TPR repeat protein
MACFLCQLVCGPQKKAAMERWANKPWKEPNNGQTFFRNDPNQNAIRAAHELRKTDQAKSYREFLSLADQGSVWSMRQVASHLLRGEGVSIDFEAAEKWLRLGVEAGDEAAMLTLANAYWHHKRYRDAKTLLSDYVGNDYPPALYLLGCIYLSEKNKKGGREMLERATVLGHRRAKWALASLFARGSFGFRMIPRGFRLISEMGDEFRASNAATFPPAGWSVRRWIC